jgi:hypothetical protein
MATDVARSCFYCGKPVGRVRKGKGEHLIPDAIGGRITTPDVCGRCNGSFSEIDRELCSRSPLSVVAAREIDSTLWQAWDVDEPAGNILLEARPDFERSGFKIYPQLIVFPSHIEYRADNGELQEYGCEKFQVLFSRRLRQLFWEHEHGNRNAFHLYRIRESAKLFARYRYPPRFFVRGSIAEACGHKSVELRFVTQTDRRMALSRLESGALFKPMDITRVSMGSYLPVIRFFCDCGKVWRALAKISVNLLHHFCERTPVNRNTFARVIAEVRGEQSFSPDRLKEGGFVCASNVASMKSDDGGHHIRLYHADGWWHTSFAFFGGKIGAVVRYPGPNHEPWTTLDIHAPLHSRDWTVTPMSFSVWMKFKIEWDDLTSIVPYEEWRWPS